MALRSTFNVPYPLDRTVIAAQDTLDQLGWNILEMSSSRMVISLPLQTVNLNWNPKMTVSLSEYRRDLYDESALATRLDFSISMPGGTLGSRKALSGLLGRFTNSLSLRVQTDSIAINPTVAIGEGQGDPVPLGNNTPSRSQQLKDLKDLLDAGLLTADEFESEKRLVLDS